MSIEPRKFLALAQSQNRAIWKSYPAGEPDAFVAALEAKADRLQALFLAARRERIEAAIRECTEHPSLFWNAPYFRLLRGSCVASTDEAVMEIKSALAAEKARRGHWSAKPERIAILGEALEFARFFRRYSRQVWARKAA